MLKLQESPPQAMTAEFVKVGHHRRSIVMVVFEIQHTAEYTQRVILHGVQTMYVHHHPQQPTSPPMHRDPHHPVDVMEVSSTLQKCAFLCNWENSCFFRLHPQRTRLMMVMTTRSFLWTESSRHGSACILKLQESHNKVQHFLHRYFVKTRSLKLQIWELGNAPITVPSSVIINQNDWTF